MSLKVIYLNKRLIKTKETKWNFHSIQSYLLLISRSMKLFLLFALFLSSGFSINFENVKDIWDSAELKPALKHLKLHIVRSFGRKLTSRIIQGQVARDGQFPHSVVMFIDDHWLCSGSIMNSRWILTVNISWRFSTTVLCHFKRTCFKYLTTFSSFQAAHCLYNRSSATIYSIQDGNKRWRWRGFSEKFVPHENFDEEFIRFDVGLIKTTEEIPLNGECNEMCAVWKFDNRNLFQSS